MRCRSKKIADSGQRIADRKRKLNAVRYTLNAKEAFSLIEAVTALIILAIVSSSVLVVINRCMASAADSALRMQALGVARENMEKLLVLDSVEEMVEYGSSDKYPEIQWQTTVETFYEPLTSQMWVRAICSAEYTDTAGDAQTVELTHWLTNLTKKEMLEIIEERQKQKEKEQLAEEDEDKPEEELEEKPEEEPEEKPEEEPEEKPEEKPEEEPEIEEPEKPERTYCGYTESELMELHRTDPKKFWNILWNCEDFGTK